MIDAEIAVAAQDVSRSSAQVAWLSNAAPGGQWSAAPKSLEDRTEQRLVALNLLQHTRECLGARWDDRVLKCALYVIDDLIDDSLTHGKALVSDQVPTAVDRLTHGGALALGKTENQLGPCPTDPLDARIWSDLLTRLVVNYGLDDGQLGRYAQIGVWRIDQHASDAAGARNMSIADRQRFGFDSFLVLSEELPSGRDPAGTGEELYAQSIRLVTMLRQFIGRPVAASPDAARALRDLQQLSVQCAQTVTVIAAAEALAGAHSPLEEPFNSLLNRSLVSNSRSRLSPLLACMDFSEADYDVIVHDLRHPGAEMGREILFGRRSMPRFGTETVVRRFGHKLISDMNRLTACLMFDQAQAPVSESGVSSAKAMRLQLGQLGGGRQVDYSQVALLRAIAKLVGRDDGRIGPQPDEPAYYGAWLDGVKCLASLADSPRDSGLLAEITGMDRNQLTTSRLIGRGATRVVEIPSPYRSLTQA